MGRAKSQRRKRALLIGVAVLAGCIGVGAYATHLLRRSELQTIDARFSIRGQACAAVGHRARGDQPRTPNRNSEAHHLESRSPFPRKYDAEVDRPTADTLERVRSRWTWNSPTKRHLNRTTR